MQSLSRDVRHLHTKGIRGLHELAETTHGPLRSQEDVLQLQRKALRTGVQMSDVLEKQINDKETRDQLKKYIVLGLGIPVGIAAANL